MVMTVKIVVPSGGRYGRGFGDVNTDWEGACKIVMGF